MRFASLVFVLLLFIANFALAEEQAYVSDKLEIQFRSGPSLQNKILRMLPSGTPLKVMEVQESSGYSFVALASGEEGWVLSRYLINQPVARTVLEANSGKLTETLEINKNLKVEIQALKNERDGASKAVKELNEEVSRLNSELTSIRQASANIIQIQNDRDALQKKNIELENTLQTVLREKQALDSSTQQNWFMIGAGVLVGGIILGIILPRISFKRKSTWSGGF